MRWQYEGKIFDPSEEDLSGWVGFVYEIEEKTTGMKYIGKKLFWRTKTLGITKTRKRKKKVLVESDWRKYFGSNKKLAERVSEASEEDYIRIILKLCKTKGECSYYEAKLQFDHDVLLREDYYNQMIMCRINSKHLPLQTEKTLVK
jgi:hypothetical protein